jgi:hypothetical protein
MSHCGAQGNGDVTLRCGSGAAGTGVTGRAGVRGVTRRRAAELLFVLTGPALYRDFALEAGRAPREWMRGVSGTLIRDLLPYR